MKMDGSPITTIFWGRVRVPEDVGIYCHLWAYDLCLCTYIDIDIPVPSFVAKIIAQLPVVALSVYSSVL